jgi:hypothetical protein
MAHYLQRRRIIKEVTMCFACSFPLRLGFKAPLAAALTFFAIEPLHAQNSDPNDAAALNAQMGRMKQKSDARMERMQKQYEDRIRTWKHPCSRSNPKRNPDRFLNTHVLTDAHGKQYDQ